MTRQIASPVASHCHRALLLSLPDRRHRLGRRCAVHRLGDQRPLVVMIAAMNVVTTAMVTVGHRNVMRIRVTVMDAMATAVMAITVIATGGMGQAAITMVGMATTVMSTDAMPLAATSVHVMRAWAVRALSVTARAAAVLVGHHALACALIAMLAAGSPVSAVLALRRLTVLHRHLRRHPSPMRMTVWCGSPS